MPESWIYHFRGVERARIEISRVWNCPRIIVPADLSIYAGQSPSHESEFPAPTLSLRPSDLQQSGGRHFPCLHPGLDNLFFLGDLST